MSGVLTGFAVILTVIAAGYIAALTGVVSGKNRLVLNRVAFYVASPALLFTIVSQSDMHIMVSPVILISAITAVTMAILFTVGSRLFFKSDSATTMLGAASSGYSNVNNIGLPVGMYVIGEISYVPPLIILQVVFFAPVILAVLEASRGSKSGALMALTRALTNPIIIGTALGVVVSLMGWQVPEFVMAPLDMIGGAAIPLVLLSFGASFQGQRMLERGSGLRMVAFSSLLKSVVAPVLAWVLAGPLFGLDAHSVFAATVISALPTAQNMYNYAATYGRGEIVVRNIVFITTFASLPVILVVALLLAA